MQRLTLLVFLLIIITQTGFSQAPADYYTTAAGKTGLELKAALHNKIKGHTIFPYTSSSTDTWDILKESDRDPANSANVILFYTGWSVSANQTAGEGWNREHVWAKSHGDFGTTNGPGTDCHHLRPADISVNAARGNMYFDYGNTFYVDPSGATGCKFNTSLDVWEPRDVEKGDAARMIFYMAVRYEGDDAFPDLEVVDYIPTNDALPLFGDLSTLIEWNQLDPVDAFEMNRNNVVYKWQKNRNPFIDHPEYVNLIWGPPVPVNIAPKISGISYSPNPVFSTDEIQFTATATDDDGTIDSVKIFWGYSSGNLTDSSLMALSNTSYSVILPAQSGATQVFFKITAWDNNHAATSSAIQSFNVENIPNLIPVISNISYSPELPSSTDLIQISASVTDVDGTLKSVKLYWGFNSPVFTGFSEMTLSSDVYTATIPAQIAGTIVYFKIKATDNIDSTSTSEVNSFTVLNPPNLFPVISNILYSPELPTSIDLLQISASVTDSDGTLKSVKLYWGFNTAVFTGFSEMQLTSDLYSASIPSQTAGTVVYFEIKATDNNDSASFSEVQSFIVNAVENVQNYENSDGIVYPNPASSFAHVKLQPGQWAIVYSTEGKQLIITRNSILDLNSLARGLYLVQILDKDKTHLRFTKFIKE